MTSQLVVDSVAQGIWTRQREDKDLSGLIAHHDHGSQPVPVHGLHRAPGHGRDQALHRRRRSSYDNALAESIIGLYKTELIKPRRPWKGVEDLEIATAEWADWFNHRRVLEYCEDLAPVEAEQAHYVHQQTTATADVSS
jgi:putative transposase